jgi:integrase
MPRPKSGPRLWLDQERESWTVIDGRKSIRTGCGKSQLQEAKDFLQEYLAANHSIAAGSDPYIADVLKVYSDEWLSTKVSAPSVASDMVNLEEWWGDKRASAINTANCTLYIAHRNAPTICRREIGFLHAAAIYWHKLSGKGPLRVMPIVFKPPTPQKRTRWLTRSEAAQFLWFGVRRLKPGQRKRLFRFFIIGWYTGTRHTAIGGTRWSMVDVEAGIMHRRPPGVAETKKRTPPVRIGRRLLSHLRRWRRIDGRKATFILERGGKASKDMGNAWRAARILSGLSKDVTPHTLRHSRATHMMRPRVDPWQAARSLGMSLEMLQSTYGHHHPDWQSDAAEAK